MGVVRDTHLISRLYSAANVTVSTSHYETFGQTMVEAQACGCLPLSFDGSGQADIIDHKENGYLAARLDTVFGYGVVADSVRTVLGRHD